MPGSSSRASLVSMSASETTPITFRSSSTTGNALTRYSRRAAAISRNVASFLTQITRVVMTSLTVVFIVSHSPRVRTTLSACVSAARWLPVLAWFAGPAEDRAEGPFRPG